MLNDGVVRIRPIEVDDTERIVKWRNSLEVKSYLYSQEDLTIEQHLWWYQNKVLTGECVQFIIEVVETDKPIGTIFIKNIDQQCKKGEYGIFIGEVQKRGMGYGTRASKLILQHAFENLQLHRVYLSVLADNSGAIKSYLSVGFREEGVLREDFLRNGDGYCDVLLMGILRDEWRN